MTKTDPTQSIVIDLFNPSLPAIIRISGVFRKDEALIYMTREITAAVYAGAPTQVIIPLYYDEIISLSCWKPQTIAGQFSVFGHCYITQGPLVNNVRIYSLFAGWISDGNPISYPPSDRTDNADPLAGLIQLTPVVIPAPVMTLTPILGMPFKVIGFNGTFTCAAPAGNRNIGLGCDDGAGNLLQVNYNPTNFPALSIVTVYGSNKYAQPTTFGNIITLPLPEMIIADPRRFVANVIGVQAGDAWTNTVAIVRPYVDF